MWLVYIFFAVLSTAWDFNGCFLSTKLPCHGQFWWRHPSLEFGSGKNDSQAEERLGQLVVSENELLLFWWLFSFFFVKVTPLLIKAQLSYMFDELFVITFFLFEPDAYESLERTTVVVQHSYEIIRFYWCGKHFFFYEIIEIRAW